MSIIYKITNNINNKVYIGKTAFSIEKRFKEHCKDAFRERTEKRPLYSAMRKYGIEAFSVEELEECEDKKSSDREAYWIGVYEAYSNGYNATLGGDGSFLYNHDLIKSRLLEHPYAVDIAREFGCCKDIVYDIAKKENIKLNNKGLEGFQKKSKTVIGYNKITNEKTIEFNSTVEAAKWCYEKGYAKTLNSGVRSHISECANG